MIECGRGAGRFAAALVLVGALCWLTPRAAHAQDPGQPPTHVHPPAADGWTVMQDGVLFAEFNHQGGPRGGAEFVVPNWWMGMASRAMPAGRLTLSAMLSLDPATVGIDGYREIFQTGEARNGRPLIDRQHPHDLVMQLAAVWRMQVGEATGLTLAGGPAAEPALGPVAFMHRASAADNPTAPLGHHALDSSHIAFGVITAAVDRGPWVVEASLFNGREPDEHRWDFDLAPLDSYSARVWFKPTDQWEIQASRGHLTDPEELEPGDLVRTTVSASWTKEADGAMSSVTAAFGHNEASHGSRSAFLVEAARRRGRHTLYARLESLQIETALFDADRADQPIDTIGDPVTAFTVGGVRNVVSWRGLDGGIGGDVSFYGVPASLQSRYTPHPVSFHVFFRVQPSAGAMGRMWNMRMSRPVVH